MVEQFQEARVFVQEVILLPLLHLLRLVEALVPTPTLGKSLPTEVQPGLLYRGQPARRTTFHPVLPRRLNIAASPVTVQLRLIQMHLL